MSTAVAEAILNEIRRGGFSIGEHRFANVVTGAVGFHVDATDPPDGRDVDGNAPSAYEAAFESVVEPGIG